MTQNKTISILKKLISMKIHILTFTNPHKLRDIKTDIDMLVESGQKLGHEVEIIYSRDCQLAFLKKPFVLIHNKRPHDINVILVRANFKGIDLDLHIGLIKQFEIEGFPIINRSLPVIRAKNKLRQLQVLTKHKIPMPHSYVVRSAEYIEDITKKIGSYPVIIKNLSGSLGLGVSIVESQRALRSLIDMIIHDDSSSGPLIIQQYEREAKGRDLRVFVVGGKIIAAMERIAKKRGEFRSNFSLGGTVRIAELTKKECEIALAATRVCELDVAGVDIIRTSKGPKVLEINSTPGLEGITLATGIDIAGKMIEYANEFVKKHKKRNTHDN